MMFEGTNNYKSIPKDLDGWIDANKYKPPKYELVTLKTNTRKVVGWWVGREWFIRKKKDNEKIEKWKKIQQKNII